MPDCQVGGDVGAGESVVNFRDSVSEFVFLMDEPSDPSRDMIFDQEFPFFSKNGRLIASAAQKGKLMWAPVIY